MRPGPTNPVRPRGGDLSVTDLARTANGAIGGYSNAAPIEPNPSGTVSDTFDAIAAAKGNGMARMSSHRSDETEAHSGGLRYGLR
ncbi:hypothetical protein [Microbacterium hatanonis]|uniref:Enolase n=1 Tax=Microbacterium hatanonis TaxID=404366 RepID=A0A5C8HZM6_9MICO|nr:hypothetical protein FVP77_15985 [Microbacterium hatanonis]